MSKGSFSVILEVIRQAESFGSRTLPDGTRLVGHVPHVAPQAWLHQVFPPLRISDVTQLEQEVLQRGVPPVYRTFLTKCSNGLGLFGKLSLDGLRRNYIRTGDAVWQPFAIETPNLYGRPRDADCSAFFIGGYNSDGSLLYLRDDRVFRCSRTSAKPLNEWTDFWTMLTSEAKRLALLFDEKGRLIRPTEPTTPDGK